MDKVLVSVINIHILRGKIEMKFEIWKDVGKEQRKLVNELKRIDKGIKSVNKKSLLNDTGLFLSTRENS